MTSRRKSTMEDVPQVEITRNTRATKGDFERAWSRHFASTQLRLDVLGTAVGSLNYIALMRQLWGLGRQDLVAAAAGCALVAIWPLLLSRWGRSFYMANRDWLFMASFTFHHLIGAQLARYVRSQGAAGMAPQGGVLFAASHLISSSVLWQAIDALMYRVRFRSFLLLQPIKIAVSLALERRLCADACLAHPREAQTFASLLEAARVAMALPLALPQHLAANGRPAAPLGACIKLQTFLLVSLAFVIPAAVIYLMEQDSRRRFAARLGCGAVSGDGGSGAGRPDGGPPAVSVGESGLMIYAPDDDEQRRGRRRAAALALALAVPAVFVAVDTLL